MALNFLRNLLLKLKSEGSDSTPISTEGKFKHKIGGGYFYIRDMVYNGYGGNRPTNMYLLNENDDTFCLKILDKNGHIVNFPGLDIGNYKNQLEINTNSRANFSFNINRAEDGLFTVEWTLQPDGRYFEDDEGYGAENCIELIACSTITSNGKYLSSFKINSADSDIKQQK